MLAELNLCDRFWTIIFFKKWIRTDPFGCQKYRTIRWTALSGLWDILILIADCKTNSQKFSNSQKLLKIMEMGIIHFFSIIDSLFHWLKVGTSIISLPPQRCGLLNQGITSQMIVIYLRHFVSCFGIRNTSEIWIKKLTKGLEICQLRMVISDDRTEMTYFKTFWWINTVYCNASEN